MLKKVIIWGHKLHSHTHSYIHHGYFRAFSSLGYETHWLDNSDSAALSGFDFADTLFFTEAQVDQSIPLIEGAPYILHNCDIQKYVKAGCKILNLCNYVRYCEDGVSFCFQGNTVEKVRDFLFYDKKASAIYQPWATDLLPHEIKLNKACLFDEGKKYINYVGSVWTENESQIRPFINECISKGKIFRDFQKVGDSENKRLVRKSYIAPDIRGDWHIECGYIPCRLFKNISYGQVTGTNSPHLYRLFGDRIAFCADAKGLFDACVEKHKAMSAADIQETMKYIEENHTYINRVNDILSMLGNI